MATVSGPIICFPDPATQQGGNLPDRMFGGRGGDRLLGFGDNDKLYGGVGRDTLIGGEGNDVLRGDGPGKGGFGDLFVFGRNSGKDVVTDFQIGKDILQIFTGLNGISNAADVLGHAHQKGKDVVIDLGAGNKIRLKNIDLDDLKKSPGDHFEITKNLSG